MSCAPRFENTATKSGRSTVVVISADSAIGATGEALTTGFGVDAIGGCAGAAVVVPPGRTAVVVFVVAVDATGFGFASSGKIRGAIAAQIHRSATEITIAAKIRFSIR